MLKTMEIRIENTVSFEQMKLLQVSLNKFFDTDFDVAFEGEYTYFRDN